MLSIAATKSSPLVEYDEERGILSIIGESYPENAFAFYAPVFDWLKQTLPRLDHLVFRVHVRYMNSSSTKCMLDILDALAERADEGADISVKWYFDAGNDRALDLADEFQEDIDIPFDAVAIEPGGSYE